MTPAPLDPSGLVCVVSDSSQVEARFNAWQAGQEDLLETFRRNDATDGDFYSDAGSVYFGRPLSKKETPTERQVAKGMELGLGFGMGEDRFASELAKGLLGAKPIIFDQAKADAFGVDVDGWQRYRTKQTARWEKFLATPSRLPLDVRIVHTAVAANFVRLYRTKRDKIAASWDLCDDVLEVMEPNGDGPGESTVRATFGPGDCLAVARHAIILPNGMRMRYPGLRKSDSGFSYLNEMKRTRVSVYGGKLVENIVQALARIAVFEQKLIIRAELERWYGARQTPIPMSTHDEIVALVPEKDAPAALAFMKDTMRRPPLWAAGLPLNASGDFARRYGDAK
jgi:DNA polymerase bacteriophage-type